MIFQDYKIPSIDRGVKLPEFTISQEDKDRLNLDDDCNHAAFLYALTFEGLANRGISKTNPDYKKYIERLKYELNTLDELGFSQYLLITWDIVRYCRENGIATGRGRGSCAGSLVLYLIGVTEVDSLKNHLYFERFLSKTRAKFKEYDGVKYYDGSLLMDIDLDIAHNQRDKVVKYLENKYLGHVCKILTVSTFTTKVLVKEVAKTMIDNFQEKDAKLVSDMIQSEFGKVHSIKQTLEESIPFKEFMDKYPEVLRVCQKIEGLIKHTGSHASAWIINSSPLFGSIPTQFTKDKEEITAYDMSDTLNLCIKVDLLGLECVTLISECCKKIGIKPTDIDINHPSIYETFKDLKYPYGLFQISDGCGLNTAKQIKPQNINDLSAVLAIARPGALQFASGYSKAVNEGAVESLHTFLDDVLTDSRGFVIYQESLLRALNKIGFSLEESEIARRIVGKKDREKVLEWEKKIKDKVKENGIPEEVGNIIWKVLNDSASYSFNKAHSLSYAEITASCTYLKLNHPKEFFLTCLEMAKETEDVNRIASEAPHYGIEIKGPSLLHSENDFCFKDGKIYFGLSHIKGLSDAAMAKIGGFRRSFQNKFEIFSAAKESGISVGVLGNLIYAGCLDEFLTENRTKTVLEAHAWNILTDKEKNECLKRGPEFSYNLFSIVKELNRSIKDDKGKPIIKDSRRETLLKKIDPYLKIYKNNSSHEAFTVYEMERRLLGFSYSHTLQDVYKEMADDLETIETVKSHLPKTNVHFVGTVKFAAEGLTKKANMPFFRVVVKDETGEITCFLYENDRNAGISAHRELNWGRLAKEDDVVVVRGQRSGDDIVNANLISIQEVKVFDKVSDVKEKDKEEVDNQEKKD